MAIRYCAANHQFTSILLDDNNEFVFKCPNCLQLQNAAIIDLDYFKIQLQGARDQLEKLQINKNLLIQSIVQFMEEKLKIIPLEEIVLLLKSSFNLHQLQYKELIQLFKVVYDDDFLSNQIQNANKRMQYLSQHIQNLIANYSEPQKSYITIVKQQVEDKIEFKQIQKENNRLIFQLPPHYKVPHAYSIALLQKGRFSAVAFGDKHPLVIFDYLNNKIEQIFDEIAYDVVELPNLYLVVASSSKVAVFNNRYEKTDLQQKSKCTRILYSSCKNFIVGTDIMTQLGQGTQIFTWNLHSNEVFPYKMEGRSGGGLALYNESCIASEIVEGNNKSFEGKIHIWRLGEAKAFKILKCRESISGLVADESGKIIGSGKHSLFIWSQNSKTLPQIEIPCTEGTLNSLSMISLGNKIILGDNDGRIIVWKLNEKIINQDKMIVKLPSKVMKICVFDQIFAGCCFDTTICFFNVM